MNFGDTPLDTLGHLLLASVFVSQGLGAIPRFDFHAGRLRERRIPSPEFVLVCGLAMMLAGGAMLASGVFAVAGATLLIVFTIVATILFQNFWTIADVVRRREKRGQFFNNLAILGGLLLALADALK
ncbi:MAG: DoxX family protein [Gemmatimonas sp.]